MEDEIILSFHTRKDFERAKRLMETTFEVCPDETRTDAQSMVFKKEKLKGCDIGDELEAYGILDFDYE